MHDLSIDEVIRAHLHDPTTSFSIGAMGAIAEYHRRLDEPLDLDDPAGLAVATRRGALRVELRDDVVPMAYETLSRRPEAWLHGVAFCLPEPVARRAVRSVVTEIGPDTGAIRQHDAGATLFDMGLSVANLDFCVRTADAGLIEALRRAEGRSIFLADNPAMAAILEANPHRLALSALGRLEVFQPIGRETTPEGPHTHVLPKFLRTKQTHSANIPIPEGLLPVLSMYPESALFDGLGNRKPFDRAAHEAFSKLLDAWGPPDFVAEKRRVRAALTADLRPEAFTSPTTRLERTALRVALRQSRQLQPDDPHAIAWSAAFDRTSADAETSDDDPAH